MYNGLMTDAVTSSLNTFFLQFKPNKYKKGEILVRAGDDPSGIFYLTKGRVREYSISQNGDEFVVNIFKPIAFFPMSWAINNTQNDYFFEAMDDVEVIKAPREKVLQFIKSQPDVLFDLLSRVFKGMDGILQRMTYLMSGRAYTRLVTELLIEAKRFGKKEGDKVTLNSTEKDIASQAGMSRETVSREFKILKEKGILTFARNEIIVPDIHKLEEELAFGL